MSRPQSILFISNHGDIVGGGEISMLQLMCALDRSQWKPLLVVPYEGAVAKEAHGSEISTLVVPLPAVSDTSMASLSSILALWRIIYQEDARIVHANGTRAMMYGGLAAKFAQRPAIWHVRVADSDGWLDRALYQFSAKIIVNSEAVSRRFTWGTADHVRCIHNGVDTVRFAPRRPSSEHRAVLGLSPYDRVVVSVGRFVAYKGYADLLAAAAILHRQDTGVHWVLVGDGELRSDLGPPIRKAWHESPRAFYGMDGGHTRDTRIGGRICASFPRRTFWSGLNRGDGDGKACGGDRGRGCARNR